MAWAWSGATHPEVSKAGMTDTAGPRLQENVRVGKFTIEPERPVTGWADGAAQPSIGWP
jgi:hypothetical protein